MTTNHYQVALVILNYNTRDLVLDLLSKIASDAKDAGWLIVVVDNGSKDESARYISDLWPDVQVIVSDTNLGFAGGNNLGISAVCADYLFLLNSDIEVTVEKLRDLIAYMANHCTVGAISPGLLTPDGEGQAFAYGDDPSLLYLLRRGMRHFLLRQSMHDWDMHETLEVDWVSGACLCVRRKVIDQVGMLDDSYFLYFEDNDWCLRMRQKGWRIVYCPSIKITHLGGKSQPIRSIANNYYYDSLKLFYDKHFSVFQRLGLRLFLPVYKFVSQYILR